MIGTVRFRSRPLAALSIVLILVGTLGGWHAPDDRDEDAVPVVHQHADHDARFGTATQRTGPEHCAFCHWVRALGNGAPVATHLFAAEVPQFIRPGGFDDFVRTTAQLALPSRAPPLA